MEGTRDGLVDQPPRVVRTWMPTGESV